MAKGKQWNMTTMKIRLLVFFMAALPCLPALAQPQNKVDSLTAALNRNPNEAGRLAIYKELAQLHHDQQQFSEGEQAVADGMALAKKLNDGFSMAVLWRLKGQIHKELKPGEQDTAYSYFTEAGRLHDSLWRTGKGRILAHEKERARLIHTLAFFHWQRGNFFESLKYYDSAIRISDRVYLKDSTDATFLQVKGTHHNGKGSVLWGLGMYDEAVAEYQRALTLFKKIGQHHMISLITGNMGLVYDSWGQKAEALAYFQSALTLARQSGRPGTLAYAYSNIGKFMEETGRYDSAALHYQKAIDLYTEARRPDGIGLSLNRLGRLQLKLGNPDGALELFFRALNMAEENRYNYWIAMSRHNISSALIAKKELSRALTHAMESNALAGQNGFKEITRDNLLNIARIYEQQGDYRKAFKTFEAYNTIKDSLFSEEKFRQITRMREQAELSEKERENELLRTERVIKESELQRAGIMRSALLTVVVLLAALAGFFVISRNKIKKVNAELTASNQAVTRQKEELAVQAGALKKTNEVKDLMLSIVSHDLRGPIHNIEQLINLLNNKTLTTEEFRNLIPAIAASINHVSNLTDNLLYWARSQMEGIRVSPAVVDLQDVMKDKISFFEKMAADKGIRLEHQIEPGSKVIADPYMLELVLRNLVSNAVKYCNPGDVIAISARTAEGKTTVQVKDTGLGIPPEDMDKLFQHMQFSTRGTKNEKGTGLGLAICKHFIELNHGEIWAESTYRKGSSFYFSLPQG
jgi:signal transduction histidine kinase/Tfp pilus assembly protein PilF